MSEIIRADGGTAALDRWFRGTACRAVLLVAGGSIHGMRELDTYFEELPGRLGIRVVRFPDFQPNPLYESAVKGCEVFRREDCDCIAAVGGGSAMDVAKCIRLWAGLDPAEDYLKQEIVPCGIPFLAVPTTAGTGSEATRYAVVYRNGEKQSVTHDSMIPQAVYMDPSLLITLPDYQRKASMLDALCHALEAYWSVHSNGESRAYSAQAVRMILRNMEAYLANDPEGNAAMLEAAHFAGKAINIAQTTAGHALCYKLTGLFGIAHGHAAALCCRRLWPYMVNHTEDAVDPRGREYLSEMFSGLSELFAGEAARAGLPGEKPEGSGLPGQESISDTEKGPAAFAEIVERLDLSVPVPESEEQLELLVRSVNPVRLKNNPVRLDPEAARGLYREILG